MSTHRIIAEKAFAPAAPPSSDIKATRAALDAHRAAVMAWLESSASERAGYWRSLESAWVQCRSTGCATQASHQSATLMRACGKLRNAA